MLISVIYVQLMVQLLISYQITHRPMKDELILHAEEEYVQ